MTRCTWDAEMDAALQADAEKLRSMGADPGPELEGFVFEELEPEWVSCMACSGLGHELDGMPCEECDGAGGWNE